MDATIDYPARAPARPLSLLLRELCAYPGGEVTIRQIVSSFGNRAFGAMIFIFAIPCLLPLPPGSTTVLGAPLMLLAPQVMLGIKEPWLPRKLKARSIHCTDLERWMKRPLPWLEKIERISKARLSFMFGAVGDRLIGLICTVSAFVLILPIPGGNIAPSITLGIMGLALFKRDGIVALVGYLAASISVGILVLSFGAIVLAMKTLFSWGGNLLHGVGLQ